MTLTPLHIPRLSELVMVPRAGDIAARRFTTRGNSLHFFPKKTVSFLLTVLQFQYQKTVVFSAPLNSLRRRQCFFLQLLEIMLLSVFLQLEALFLYS